jgi:Na+/proline symporter
VIFFQFSLFLIIGVILSVFYRQSGSPPPQPADRIYPEFVWNYLPPGVSGLVIAAILAAAMSNLSAALNSLASTSIMDFYKPMVARRGGPGHSEAQYLRLARGATVGWGAVLLLIGWLARKWGSVLEAGLSIASILYGSLLGVFLLGLLTKRVGERAAMAGMLAGLITMWYVRSSTNIAWTWYVLIGTSATLAVGLLSSFLIREQRDA